MTTLEAAAVEDPVRAAARLLGRRTSPAKAAAARANGKRGGRPVRSVGEFRCTCGDVRRVHAALQIHPHVQHCCSCPQGQAIVRRLRRGLPVE